MKTIKMWATNHKFWSSVVILYILGTTLALFGIINAFAGGRLLGFYILLGSFIWGVQAKKLRWVILAYLLITASIIILALTLT